MPRSTSHELSADTGLYSFQYTPVVRPASCRDSETIEYCAFPDTAAQPTATVQPERDKAFRHASPKSAHAGKSPPPRQTCPEKGARRSSQGAGREHGAATTAGARYSSARNRDAAQAAYCLLCTRRPVRRRHAVRGRVPHRDPRGDPRTTHRATPRHDTSHSVTRRRRPCDPALRNLGRNLGGVGTVRGRRGAIGVAGAIAVAGVIGVAATGRLACPSARRCSFWRYETLGVAWANARAPPPAWRARRQRMATAAGVGKQLGRDQRAGLVRRTRPWSCTVVQCMHDSCGGSWDSRAFSVH
jgi:hypothetical protein